MFATTICLFLVLATTRGEAAEFRLSKSAAFATLILEGEIVVGDYGKFDTFLKENCREDYGGSCFESIYLASPGGSVGEAMKIGTLVRKLRLTTVVPEQSSGKVHEIEQLDLANPKDNYLCASACFFVAVAGIDREVSYYDPILGIHRPYFTDADLTTLSADQTIESSNKVRAIVESYLQKMNVNRKYIDIIFSVNKNDIRWISRQEYESDFGGIILDLRDWLSVQINKCLDTKDFANSLVGEKPEGPRHYKTITENPMRTESDLKEARDQRDCEWKIKDKMRHDAWLAYRDR